MRDLDEPSRPAHARARRRPVGEPRRRRRSRAHVVGRSSRSRSPTATTRRCLYAPARTGRAPLVVLAGHLDTVPAQGNLPGRLEDGARARARRERHEGRRRRDDRARALGRRRTRRSRSTSRFVFFPREEIAVEESPLPALFDTGAARRRRRSSSCSSRPTTRSTPAASATSTRGSTFRGVSAHSAGRGRGVNAIERAVEGLAPRRRAGAAWTSRCRASSSARSVTVTRIEGGIADNVVPAEASRDAERPLRARPHRASRREAGPRRCSRQPTVELDVLDDSPPARPSRSTTRSSQRLRAAGELAVEPKQAWTPVAAVRRARPRRGQPRPRRDPLRAPRRRAGRGRRARAHVRGPASLRSRVASGPCRSPPCSPRSARTRSCGSTRRSAAPRRRAASSCIDFGDGRPARAARPGDPRRRWSTRSPSTGGYPLAPGPARAARARSPRWARPPLRRRARSRPRGDPDARQQGGDLHRSRRSSLDRDGRARRRRLHGARLPGLRARRALRGRRGACRCRCSRRTASCPTSTRSRAWDGVALLWVNYPNNPTGAVAPLDFYERAAELARRHDFVLASDEAYTELWFDEPPASRAAGRRPDATCSSSTRSASARR